MAWGARWGFLRKSRGKGWRGKKAHESLPSVFSLEQTSREITSACSLGSHLLLFFQGHFVAQCLQTPYRRVALAAGIQRLKEVRPQIMVVLVAAQQLIDDHQQAVRDGDHGTLGPPAASQPMVLGRQIVVRCMADDPHCLRQSGTQ